MPRLRTHVVLSSIAFLFPLSLAHAALIFSDNFDGENGGAGTFDYTGFANWTITAGDVDLLGNGFGDRYPGNGLYLDLDGDPVVAGVRLETTQTFDPGEYQLNFDLAGGARNDANNLVTISLGDFSETFDLTTANSGFETFTRTATIAAGTSQIVIDHNVHADPGDAGGPILDNIALNTIPEPSSLILGVLALPFVWAWRKNRS